MTEEIRTSKRDLIARVAALELLTADLIAVLWRLDPKLMDDLAHEAERDLTIQNSRTLPAAEHQRERLFSVLQDRKRRLAARPPAAARPKTPAPAR